MTPKILFGIFDFDKLSDEDSVRMLDVAQHGGITELDCGAIYVSACMVGSLWLSKFLKPGPTE